MYLETIFASPDIVRQLPEEAAMFQTVDKGWKEIMQRTNDSPNAINAGTYPGMRDLLAGYNVMLDKVQKQLES
jgi:dynein heavy chain